MCAAGKVQGQQGAGDICGQPRHGTLPARHARSSALPQLSHLRHVWRGKVFRNSLTYVMFGEVMSPATLSPASCLEK